ncbi:adenylosuccinate lyase, partial [bacterium]
ILLHYMLRRFTGVVKNLLVYPENMIKNINRTGGLPDSQRVLIALVEKGVTREDAYAMVQRNAMRVWLEGEDYKKLLKSDPEVAKLLTAEEVDGLFDIGYHTKHVDTIFRRVFGEI